MRIGIEAQRVFRRNKHGMDYVVLQEIKELQQIDHKNEYFVFVSAEHALSLDTYSHICLITFAGTPATSE